MDLVKNFGTLTNFVLSLSVILYGFLWLKDRSLREKLPFRIRAYRCWWASWACWVLAWGVLLGAALSGSDPVPLGLKILTLFFDNLNSVFMFLVYFIVINGDDFDKSKIFKAFVQISGTVAFGCVILYLLSSIITLDFAYEVHRTWSLCIGVFAPMLVGWACNLRYNTRLVLVVGFAYGFMQPFVYATELVTVTLEALQPYKPVIAMTLGGLKVLWAIVFTQVLAHGSPNGDSLMSSRTNLRFHFFSHPNSKVLGHALVLGIIYCMLLIILAVIAKELNSLATALTIITGFMLFCDLFWKWLDKGNKRRHTHK